MSVRRDLVRFFGGPAPLPGAPLAGGRVAGGLQLRGDGAAGSAPPADGAVLDLALGRPIGPRDGAIGLDGVTLENLGAAMLQWLGVHAVDDRLRAIAFLCLAYVPGTALPFAERLAAVVADADLRGLMAVENRARVRSEFDAQGMLTAPEGVYRQVLAL